MFKTINLLTVLFCLFFTLPAHASMLRVSANPEKINLVWQADFTNKNADFSKLPPVEGVNIVSPCWFSMDYANGHIKDKGSKEYADAVHARGYQIWALISNSFDPDLTSDFLQNPKARKNFLRQLLIFAEKYQLEGFNIDFENISYEDRDLLSGFIKEIAEPLRARGLIISMDVTVPSDEPYWSLCYDRKALSDSLDYLMLMAYDQHHPLSHSSGSTASLNWVESKLQETLTQVPAEKLVLGLPLYTRKWKETPGSSYAVGTTLSMPKAEQLIKEKKITPRWQEIDAQYYLEYTENKKTYKIWQENRHSLQAKTALVRKYNLAGIASWRKGFETKDVWTAINGTLYGLETHN